MKSTDPEKHIIERGGEYIGSGARNDVFRATVGVIVDDRRRDITMALRRPKTANGARKLYDEAKRWEMLRDAGIPVAHATYRLNETNTAVCCTDLTCGGTKYVFSDTNKTADDAEWESRLAAGDIVGNVPNGPEALKQLCEIAVACAREGCEFMLEDAFYFVIDKKTLHITPSIGDYKHVVTSQQEPLETAINNLDVARNAVLPRHAVFGLSKQDIADYVDARQLAVLEHVPALEQVDMRGKTVGSETAVTVPA